MVPAADHDFFTAAAAAVGTLIGLLFVALSVWRESDDGRGRVETHRLRAAAALSAFTNALTVSLFALVPQDDLGETVTILAIVGLVSIIASALRVWRLRREEIIVRARDVLFIVGGGVLFTLQLLRGMVLWKHPHESRLVNEIAELTILFLLFGIGRSWELIGGPEVGFIREAVQMLHPGPNDSASAPADAASAPAGAASAPADHASAAGALHPTPDAVDSPVPGASAHPPTAPTPALLRVWRRGDPTDTG
jgi:hypothetical protein